VSFQRVALWSKSHWSEPKEKEKKKDRIIIEAPHVLCIGVATELTMTRLVIVVGNMKSIFFFHNDL